MTHPHLWTSVPSSRPAEQGRSWGSGIGIPWTDSEATRAACIAQERVLGGRCLASCYERIPGTRYLFRTYLQHNPRLAVFDLIG